VRYLLAALAGFFALPAPAADLPKFKSQEIDTGLKIGYAVVTADVDGDKKPDIVVVDQHKVVWYLNPGKPGEPWKKHTMLDGKTRPDNVCVAPIDIDGDGLPEFVLGAAWKPFDTTNAAQLVWLKRGKNVTDEWSMHELPCDEPTVHRVRVADLDGDGKPEIVMAPLMGRDSTAKGKWTDGRPVNILRYKVPEKDPEKKASWKPEVLSNELHVVHNFDICYQVYSDPKQVASIMTASDAGVHALWIGDGKVTRHNAIALRDPKKPDGPKSASEVRAGYLSSPMLNKGDATFSAAVEPWHGNQITVYVSALQNKRTLLDENLRWGHAIQCADLDGDGGHEIIVGVRDDPNPKMGDTFKERRGVRVYKCTDGKGEKWERTILDDGGVAVEDLTAADLDGDGKTDIIAVGRATGNCKIFWNQGK
jgi:hypothetical protein